MKKWQVATPIADEFKNRFPQLNDLVLQLLFNRGVDSQQKIDEFLNPDYIADLHNPFLFDDMKKAVSRIFQTIEEQKKIVVYGDYDADGVTGSVILIKTLKFLGGENIDVYIPHREREGYGLNKNAVCNLNRQGCNLIITTDCGISNVAETRLAGKLGIDVIITDHHHALNKLPPAHALINPKIPGSKYPFNQLAGAGVAFKLAQALLIEFNARRSENRHFIKNFQIGWEEKTEAFEKWLLDLVAIGTIADCCPLIGENRTLIKYGLIVLNKTSRIGLRRLIEDAGYELGGKRKLTTHNISFQIGPRINAAGRMDHATTAFKLLTTNDLAEAKKLSANLIRANQRRQAETENIFKKARKQALTQQEDYVIFAHGKNWPIGIVGLVGGKLTGEFNRPTVVICETDDKTHGSARSIPQFNIVEALAKTKESLSRYGGHSQAAGFTLKNKNRLTDFEEKLKKLAKETLQSQDLSPTLNIDSEIKLNSVNWELFEDLEQLEPFGDANPEPIFLIKQTEVVEIRGVGRDEKHLRLQVRQDDKFFTAIGFCFCNIDNSAENWRNKLNIGDLVDLVVNINVNEWNGNRELQLKLVDIRKSDIK